MHTVLAKHFRVQACIVWQKRVWGGGCWIRPQWEMAYLLFKGKPPGREPDVSDVWDIPRLLRPQHPCEKPTALLRQAIELVTDPGQLGADPFAGITSTRVAALECAPRFWGGRAGSPVSPDGGGKDRVRFSGWSPQHVGRFRRRACPLRYCEVKVALLDSPHTHCAYWITE